MIDKTVSNIWPCYEILVKEFILNISPDRTIKRSQEYMKVYVRQKRVKFSPSIIDAYLGRNKSAKSDTILSMDKISNEITIG